MNVIIRTAALVLVASVVAVAPAQEIKPQDHPGVKQKDVDKAIQKGAAWLLAKSLKQNYDQC